MVFSLIWIISIVLQNHPGSFEISICWGPHQQLPDRSKNNENTGANRKSVEEKL